MEEIALLVTTNLVGTIGGCVRSENEQSTNGYQYALVKKIKHTDRIVNPCTRVTKISKSTLNAWLAECPYWEKPGNWKNYSRDKKILSHVARFDEGYGVSYN